MEKIAYKLDHKLERKDNRSGFLFAPSSIGLSDSGASRSMTSGGGAYFINGGLVMDELEMRYQMELQRLTEIMESDMMDTLDIIVLESQ